MNNQEFRRYGHQIVDWMADYLQDIRQYPVLPNMNPGELVAKLPSAAPEQSESMDAVLEDFEQSIIPAMTHWNHPRFFAYFAISGSMPGILGEMLAATLNVNGMLWKSCPALTELEQVTLSWLRQWMSLPPDWFGIIYDTASISSMHAIAAAREMADPEARLRGADGSLVLYTSEHSHSSIEKGAITLGIGQNNVRRIPVDENFRMRVDVLRERIAQDQRSGKKPFCIVATVGTTSTSSIDPVPAIADVAREIGAWLHIDAAYGGSAAVVPELRGILNGTERAQSLVVNPHKWLFTPVDLSVLYTSRPDLLRHAFSLIPEYLKTAEDPRAVNYMDYGVQLGRRFRALKLWFVMRHFGHQEICRLIRAQIEYAQRFAEMIRADPNFEVSAPTPFSLICFRYRGSDDDNRVLLEKINASGKAFLSHTVLNGQYVIRLAIGNIATQWEDLEDVWKLIRETARQQLSPANANGSN